MFFFAGDVFRDRFFHHWAAAPAERKNTAHGVSRG
jgi:hypothetical protein